MDDSQEVKGVCSQLIEALHLTLDPSVSQLARGNAYNLFENVKEQSTILVPCGFYLLKFTKEPIVHHLGLQLLEHTIKCKWVDLEQTIKVYIKENIMSFIAMGMDNISVEELFIKDKVSQLVVEMIKREWPQQWPNLMTELYTLASCGPVQTELVCLILLRLAEDVATLQTVESQQRRRDLIQALTQNMKDIFNFFLTCLESSFTIYKKEINDDKSMKDTLTRQHCRVIQVVLVTLSLYVEWVNPIYIFTQEGKLLHSLCVLMQEEFVMKEAGECLLQIVNRKGILSDEKSLLYLFGEQQLSLIVSAAENGFRGGSSVANYQFLKILTQVLAAAGSQLLSCWGKEPSVATSCNFARYLQVMLVLSSHASFQVFQYCRCLWHQMFKHEQMCKNEQLLKVIPEWVQLAHKKIRRHGFPSKNESESCTFARLDFDDDDDYSVFLNGVISDTLFTVQVATEVFPNIMYEYVRDYMLSQLNQNGNIMIETKEFCQPLSKVYTEWEALTRVLEIVITRLSNSCLLDNICGNNGCQLLRLSASYQTQDPIILSSLLSCISTLLVFIHKVPEVLSEILNKIFGIIATSKPDKNFEAPHFRAMKNLRHHACYLLVRMTRDFGSVMEPMFDVMCQQVHQLTSIQNELSSVENVTLFESLVLLSNRHNDYVRQCTFITNIFAPTLASWQCLKEPCTSPESFMAFIGLDQEPIISWNEDVLRQNRQQLTFCTTLLAAMLKRSQCPLDAGEAEKGGFIGPLAGGGIGPRNPVTPIFLQMLHQFFCLMRVCYQLWNPAMTIKRSVGFAKATDYTRQQFDQVLGYNPYDNKTENKATDSNIEVSPLEHMQRFLQQMAENCIHIIGNAANYLGAELFQFPHLSEYVIHSALENLHLMPDYILWPLFKRFLKIFMSAMQKPGCPVQCYQTVALPILLHLCPYMLRRLSEQWGHYAIRVESGLVNDDDNDLQEVMDDQLLRICTREYNEMLKKAFVILVPSDKVCDGNFDQLESTNGDEGMEEGDGGAETPMTLAGQSLSPMGLILLKSDVICQSVVTTWLRCLSWHDTTSSMKAAFLLDLVLPWLLQEGDHLLNSEAVTQVMTSILAGLHTHGQHDPNRSQLTNLALTTYQLFRPNFPQLKEVLLNLPSVTEEIVMKLESQLFGDLSKNVRGEKNFQKKRRETFKKIVDEIVGQNVGQTLRKRIQIRELPPMFKRPRPEQPDVIDSDGFLGLDQFLDQKYIE